MLIDIKVCKGVVSVGRAGGEEPKAAGRGRRATMWVTAAYAQFDKTLQVSTRRHYTTDTSNILLECSQTSLTSKMSTILVYDCLGQACDVIKL